MLFLVKNIIAGAENEIERKSWKNSELRIKQIEIWLQKHASQTPRANSLDKLEVALAQWISAVRAGRTTLSKEHIQKLEALDISLLLQRNIANSDQRINQLATWLKKYNGTMPSQIVSGSIEDGTLGKTLGKWLTRVRCGDIELNDEQKHKLQELGVVIKKKFDRASANERLIELEKWLKDNNGSKPSYKSSLSSWLGAVKSGLLKLDSAQLQKLSDLGIDLNKQYFRTPDQRIDDVEDWFKTKVVNPSKHSKNKEERSIALYIEDACRERSKLSNAQWKRLNALGIYIKAKRTKSRHLDTRKATGNQLSVLSQKQHRIIKYETPLRVGTALLDGRFEKDTTNIFNPNGLNTPSVLPKHEIVKKAGSFTVQEAVETTVYSDMRDLLHCFESSTNFDRPNPNRRKMPKNPEIQGTKVNIHKISEAEGFVLQLAEKLSKEDSDNLLDAYETAVSDPGDWNKSKNLVQIVKDLKIKYNNDLFTAYILLLSENYENIISQIRLIQITDENREALVETVTKLTLINQGLAEDRDAYEALCAKYRIKLDGKFNQIVRIIRINMLRLSAETRQMMQDITSEAEELAIIR